MSVSKIGQKRSDNSSLRVLTYNIFNTEGGWEQRRPVLIDGLRELDADIMGFQETVLTDEFDQVSELVGSGHHIIHSKHREPGAFGVSIASRWPIVRVEELDLRVTDRAWSYACTTLIAEIIVPGPVGRVFYVNHFPDYQPSHEYERELQTVIAARRIEELVGDLNTHVILGGDLDAEHDSASLRFLVGKQSLSSMSVCYRNVWDRVHQGDSGLTFTSESALVAADKWDWPFQRIDHLLVRCGMQDQPTLNIIGCELAFAESISNVWASDHFAVVADLEVPALQADAPV